MRCPDHSILRRLKLAGVALLLALPMVAAAQSISIQLENGAFKVKGWNPPATAPAGGWTSTFAIYAGAGDVPPLLGTYAVESGTLVFHPRFPFAPGVHYRAVFKSPAGGAPITRTFDGPPRETARTARVEHIYPSSGTLPNNQLRIYFYFSAPMSRNEAGQHVHILDENGKSLPDVFLPGEELWDPGYRRLTLTLDPGRIKRGLTSNQKMGPPIAEGKRYTLVVDQAWPDARGVPMIEGARKSFRGGAPRRIPPDPTQWRITAPKPGSTDALVVDFPTPMNYPLLMRMITVNGPRGTIPGTIKTDRAETQWRFTPAQPWASARYQLVVDTAIEDLAGNHIGQPFDVDTFDHVTSHITTKTVPLPFEIR